MFLLLALLIGVIAGLRAMTAPAAVAWGAALGWFDVSQTPLAFMGFKWTPWIFTLLAVVELITDQLPSTPSRKVPVQFGARIVTGALAGATIGAASGLLFGGLIAGVIGAVIGTYGGAALRGRLAASFGKDLPAALIEDAVAVIGALLIVAVS
ncbi:membrane protein [Rhizobium leguminosarum]|uniref:membrane protein n=1 Tax=Rhizobium leguminosarum TaxID=384 RepID=UPI000481F592|nr:membrane protein [Rhizobium leguminosarum]